MTIQIDAEMAPRRLQAAISIVILLFATMFFGIAVAVGEAMQHDNLASGLQVSPDIANSSNENLEKLNRSGSFADALVSL